MPLVSWVLAGATSIPNGMPYLSTATWILTPRIFLPPSMPRVKQLGAERQERLSITTVLGSAVSPQASRQVRRSRASSRRHTGPAGKEGVQRAERDVAEQPNRPPLHAAEPDAPNRHDRLAQRCSRQRRLRPGAGWPSAICRHPLKFHQHLVNEGLDVTESIPRGRRGLGGSVAGVQKMRIPSMLGV